MKIQISLFARLVKHLPHQPNQSKTIFLVRLRCSNRKLTRKLFHNRQTKLSGYSTSGRIKPSCYSSLLFRRLFHIALNINVETQRMGNGNKVLTTKTSSLSRQVPLLQHEADERVIPHQPTSHVTSGHSLDAPSMSPLSPSYLVVLITSKRGKLISAGTLATVVASYVVLIS